MADNVIADPGAGGATFASIEFSFSGDTVQAPGSFIFGASGSEGSWTVGVIPGDATDGLLVNLGTNNDVINGGTFVVQEDGAALTALQLIDDVVATLGTTTYSEATTKGNVLGVVRNDTLAALANTDNEIAPLQVNASGALYIQEGAALDVSAATVTVDWGGTAPPIGAGVEATALRVTLATDSTGQVKLAAGSASIGTLGANSGIDIGDVDVLTYPGPADAKFATLGQKTKAGSMPVTLASDEDALNTIVTNAGTFVVQEDGAALTALQLIDDPVFADDAPFTLTTSKTMVAGAIRDDIVGTLAAAEGDVVPLRVDQEGHLHVHSHVFDPGTIDGFGHLLLNESVNQVEIQFFRDTPANLLTVTTAGGGATSQVGGAGKFETSAAGTANAKGVTALTTSYRSASEVFVLFSVLFTTPTDGNGFQRIGLYDDNNGVFIGFEGTTFGVSIRNATSDTQVAKASFSEDTLVGSSGSMFTRDGSPEAIDFTKFNVFRIRFGWLGSAPIFFEVLSPDGNWLTFHTIHQPNNAIIASMEDPDLPMTLQVSKTAADATNLIMLTNCWAAGVTSGALPLDETLTDDNLAKIVRTVIVGKTAGGTYVNVQTTNSGNLKMALDEYDGVPTGPGVEAGTLRVTLPTDGTGIVGLATGSNAIGKLAANSGVDIGDVDVTSIAAGSALIGDVGLSGARTSGGSTIYKNIDVDAKDEIKATAGQVYWIHAMNTTAAPVFLKFYDLAAASVTVGTTVPDLTFLVPANADSDGAGFALAIPNGIEFGTGITIAGTGLVADNDNTALGANALIVNLGFA